MARLGFKKTGCFGSGKNSATFPPKSKFCRNPYFWPKLAETEYSVGHYLKVYFRQSRVGHYRILPIMNRSVLMYYLKFTSCIQLKNQKIKTLNLPSVVKNAPKLKEKKCGLSVSAILCWHTWTVPDQRTYSMSITFIRRL